MTTNQTFKKHADFAHVEGNRFVSLRVKFVLFFSLILIVTSSALSWYFIESKRATLNESLNRVGAILLTNTVNNNKFRFAGVIAGDQSTLEEFTDSLMAVEEVQYVVVRGPDKAVLAQRNKLASTPAGSPASMEERRFYPDESIAEALFANPVPDATITSVALSRDHLLVPTPPTTDWIWLISPHTANLYDFAMPISRIKDSGSSRTPLPFELQEGTPPVDGPVQGLLQIGLSDAIAKQKLITVIRNVFLLTLLIIGAGILGAHLLTLRITIPLRSLAGVAREVAEGGTPPPLPLTTSDEVGQLTQMVNVMTQALQERNAAINSNMNTIRKQISQLTTVHQTSAAITSTLDLNELMNTVLSFLMTNLGFSRMVLILRHEDEDVAYVAQVAGVSDEISDAARQLTFPIKDDGTLMSQLFIHAQPILVQDINDVAHRMNPAILALSKRVGISSFVLVPLQTHNRTLGFLGGNRGDQLCTEDDLNILLTIASHVATAIDNARAYANLARLTQSLEYRIQQRTQELSIANEQLREHDRRRTMFVSVASHELRTPMTAIRSFADNMLDGVAGELSERQITYLNRIGHNLNRLTRIINLLLDWSRLDMKKEVLRLEPLCIAQISGLVVESVRPMAEDKSVTVHMENPAQLPLIRGDRDKLEQILWNIIGNAVKFTPASGRVTVSFAAVPENMVQVCVADTGCGIPPEYLDRLFNEFSKIPSAIPSSQGAQLGLFITKSYIEMHQGRIWAESELGIGTRMCFTIPCAPTDSQGEHASPQIVTPG